MQERRQMTKVRPQKCKLPRKSSSRTQTRTCAQTALLPRRCEERTPATLQCTYLRHAMKGMLY